MNGFGLALGSPPHLAAEIAHGRDEREALAGSELRLVRVRVGVRARVRVRVRVRV